MAIAPLRPVAGCTRLLDMSPSPITQLFSDFLGTEVAQVSKAFRRNVQDAMIHVALQIKMTDRDSVRFLQGLDIPRPLPAKTIEQLQQEISGKVINSPMITGVLKAEQIDDLHTRWWRASELLKSLTPEEVEKTRPLWESGLHATLERLNDCEEHFQRLTRADELPYLAALRDIPDRRSIGLRLFVEDYPSLREICIRVSMMRRFNKAVREQQLDYTNRQQIVRCFKAMHASQSSSADFCAAGQARFAQALTHQQTRALALEEQGPLEAQETFFSFTRFGRLETAIWDSEMREKGKHLHAFWAQFINNGVLVGGLNPPRTAYEKSLWLRDVSNAPAIAHYQYLYCRDLQAIPDEIQALKIRYLRIEGGEDSCLSTLPEVFGE